MRFKNFILSVHPDPDTLYAKTVAEAHDEIAKLADHYHSALGNTHCTLCGNEIDKPRRAGQRNGRCSACFTSNA